MANVNIITKLFTFILLLILSTSVFAQEPKKYSFVDGLLTAGWATAAAGDRWSTHRVLSTCLGCREASPFKSANTRMAIQFSALGAVEFLQYKYPERRTTFRVFKGLMVGMASAVVIHNLSKVH